MNIIDHFTNIDELLEGISERIGATTEPDTHFFAYPNDGSRATLVKGTTVIDFMAGTVMTPDNVVSSLGNSLRARGAVACRSLSLQADQNIIVHIGTKAPVPIFAGTWFRLQGVRFETIKLVCTDTTGLFCVACTSSQGIEMAGESYIRGDDGTDRHAVAVNSSGEMIAVIKGANGVNVNVDLNGYMSAVMKGNDGGTYRDINVDGSGNMITRMKGSDGANLHDIAVNSSGEMLANMRGDDGGTPRSVAVDSDGNMISRMKGADVLGNLKDIYVDSGGKMITRLMAASASGQRYVACDNDGQLISLMKAQSTSGAVTVACDDGGNMISVMKGYDGSALRTWKVDDEGRGEMFIADTEDVWGNKTAMGLGELANRIDAPPMVFDKRGTVVKWIDFNESGVNYSLTHSANSTISRDMTVCDTGSASMKSIVTTASCTTAVQNVINDYHSGRLGYQAKIYTDSSNIVFKLRVFDKTPTNYYYAELIYDRSNDNLMINTPSNASYVIDSAVKYTPNTYNFSTLKLVVDTSTHKYVRAIVFGAEYDLTAHSMKNVAVAGSTYLGFIAGTYGGAAATETLWIDNIIITENEPEN